MHRLLRLLLAVLVSVPLVGALAACGGDDIGSKSAQDVLKETFGPNKPVKSGKLDLTVAFNAKGLPSLQGPLRLELQGPFQSKGGRTLPAFDFDLDFNLSGQAVRAGAISTGDKGYLKFAGSTFDIGDATFQRFKALYERDQKRTKTTKNPTFQTLGVDPTRWLQSPKKAADEPVGGTDTVHVTSAVDVPAFLEDINKLLGRAGTSGASAAAGAAAGQAVPTKLTDAQRSAIERSVKATNLDVFAGKADGTLRRLNINVTFDVPADLRKTAGGLTTGTFGLDLVIADLNQAQDIKPPSGARPLSDLNQAIGATGATGAAPQASSGTSAAPSSADARYSKCLSSAGGDIAKVQACAPLLNGG